MINSIQYIILVNIIEKSLYAINIYHVEYENTKRMIKICSRRYVLQSAIQKSVELLMQFSRYLCDKKHIVIIMIISIQIYLSPKKYNQKDYRVSTSSWHCLTVSRCDNHESLSGQFSVCTGLSGTSERYFMHELAKEVAGRKIKNWTLITVR